MFLRDQISFFCQTYLVLVHGFFHLTLGPGPPLPSLPSPLFRLHPPLCPLLSPSAPENTAPSSPSPINPIGLLPARSPFPSRWQNFLDTYLMPLLRFFFFLSLVFIIQGRYYKNLLGGFFFLWPSQPRRQVGETTSATLRFVHRKKPRILLLSGRSGNCNSIFLLCEKGLASFFISPAGPQLILIRGRFSSCVGYRCQGRVSLSFFPLLICPSSEKIFLLVGWIWPKLLFRCGFYCFT